MKAAYTAENSKPENLPSTPDGVVIGKWHPCGFGQEKRRKIVYKTEFYTGVRMQWWSQSQTHYTQRRAIGDTSDRFVESDIWTRERGDMQGLGIQPI